MTSTGSEEPNSHSPESIITLNVGGKIFQTTLQTLTTLIPYYDNAEEDEAGIDSSKEEQDHLLRTMFLNKEFNLQRDKDGNVFIDRNPTTFEYILEFLRCEGITSLFHYPQKLAANIATEAKYFGLVKLEELASGTYLEEKLSLKLQNIPLPKHFEHRQLKQLYLAFRDGFSSKVFHEKCDNQGPTLVYISTTMEHHFYYAGILDGSWNSNNEVVHGRHSKICFGPHYAWTSKKRLVAAAFSHAEYGPIFGSSLEDFDLKVDGSMKELQVNNSPKNYYRIYPNSGIEKFTIKDIEVLQFLN